MDRKCWCYYSWTLSIAVKDVHHKFLTIVVCIGWCRDRNSTPFRKKYIINSQYCKIYIVPDACFSLQCRGRSNQLSPIQFSQSKWNNYYRRPQYRFELRIQNCLVRVMEHDHKFWWLFVWQQVSVRSRHGWTRCSLPWAGSCCSSARGYTFNLDITIGTLVKLGNKSVQVKKKQDRGLRPPDVQYS